MKADILARKPHFIFASSQPEARSIGWFGDLEFSHQKNWPMVKNGLEFICVCPVWFIFSVFVAVECPANGERAGVSERYHFDWFSFCICRDFWSQWFPSCSNFLYEIYWTILKYAVIDPNLLNSTRLILFFVFYRISLPQWFPSRSEFLV